VNSSNASAERVIRNVQEAARAKGVQLDIVKGCWMCWNSQGDGLRLTTCCYSADKAAWPKSNGGNQNA